MYLSPFWNKLIVISVYCSWEWKTNYWGKEDAVLQPTKPVICKILNMSIKNTLLICGEKEILLIENWLKHVQEIRVIKKTKWINSVKYIQIWTTEHVITGDTFC